MNFHEQSHFLKLEIFLRNKLEIEICADNFNLKRTKRDKNEQYIL